jgi:polyphosphate kinase
MDFSVEDEDVDNLMMSIGRKLLQRRQRPPIRLEYPSNYHKSELVTWLKEKLDLDDEYLYSINGYLHLKQFFELISKVRRPDLLEPEWPIVPPAAFAGCKNIFEAIDNHEYILLAPPFHSFSPVTRLLEEAATDPNVLAIKQT